MGEEDDFKCFQCSSDERLEGADGGGIVSSGMWGSLHAQMRRDIKSLRLVDDGLDMP